MVTALATGTAGTARDEHVLPDLTICARARVDDRATLRRRGRSETDAAAFRPRGRPNVSDSTTTAQDSEFDPDALRRKYRLERDKRLRPDGNTQYVELAGAFAAYLEDPYTDAVERAPLTDDVGVAIIGGGFAGLITGARLTEAGIDDFRIIEKGGDFGGTWYWNRYPGAQCDVEPYVYLPLLEETSYVPSEKYVRAPEILEHCHRIARHFDLYERSCLSTEVTAIEWDDVRQRWTVTTNRGDRMSAQFLVMGNGPLHRPKLPGIPGIESFKGHSFHTSRWDYGYTGGTSAGDLTKLADKRIGVIGTGATAVQCVPHLGAWAKELYVFQRTPSSVDVRADRPTDPDWVKSLRPGWHKERIDNFTAVISGGEFDVDLVNDGWTDLIGNILLAARRRAKAGEPVEDPEALVQLADYQKMEQVRARVDSVVSDRETAEALKPWYNQFCKRPCFHDEYLPTFNRPNVHLVDTKGEGVERITENGVGVAGTEYEIDCLIYATGFEEGTSYTRRAGYQIYGRGGRSLGDKWKQGAETMHSMFTRGFPNCFVLSTMQSGQSANFQHMLDEKARHIAFVVGEATAQGVTTLEPSEAAEKEWVDTVVKLAVGRRAF